MTQTTTAAVTKRRATRYQRLDYAVQAVFNDVLDHCETVREEAEQRLGTTDEDTIVDDPTYGEALDLFAVFFDLKSRIQGDLRTRWIGDQ
ncbi:hypothetical protein GCM10009789_11420 [Kribbella sancticallisti]|uniref:Uncharacterized protein n=1 Tax=Kribbella sancticallisti TaxID=460087 RepID=A0ABP4NG64_9ACTN